MRRECPFERKVRQETLDIVAGKLRRIRTHARLDDASSMSNSYDALKDMMKRLDDLIEDVERESARNDLEISR